VEIMDRAMTRRAVLQGGAALAGALALGVGRDEKRTAGRERPTLVLLWLNGGPAGLFNSAGSFLPGGAFGVATNNVVDLGNGLMVDARSLGALPPVALGHMASVNFRHEIPRPHERARAAVLEADGHSQLLRLAAALPDAAFRCAVVNGLGLPVGVSADPPAEAGVRLEHVRDLGAITSRVGGRDVDLDGIRAVYGLRPGVSNVDDLAATFATVEMLVRAGAGVVFAQPAYTGRADRQFDTHGDDTGVQARAVMAPITPVLGTFLERALALPGRNVVTVLVGEFSRTVPASDHEPGGTATVIGRRVRTGTAGPQGADGAPPTDAPKPDGLWAYVTAALGLDTGAWGRNPHPELLAAG
jgi:hypothetical protein